MTERCDCDVLVLGGGFGGCLTALILQRLGISVAVAERMRHPRFVIGESSTPAADLLLSRLCERYELPELEPLTRYGSWKTSLPQLGCGLKRGFSYFWQQAGATFQESRLGEKQLLVAASASDAVADTHWLRADVDRYFADCLQQRGVFWRDECRLEGTRLADGWLWQGQTADGPVEIRCRFVVDGTGPRGVIPRMLGIDPVHHFETRSSAIYGHFVNVAPWAEQLPDHSAHPFACDAAAVHHILEEGWMWQLRFDDGRISCGLVFDDSKVEPSALADQTMSPVERWQSVVRRYPSLTKQFARAQCVAPEGGLVRTSRLQRRWQRTAGPDWLLLPSTAGFIDPLHSTGIAHTMIGVTRLAELFEQHWRRPSWENAWLEYDRPLQYEFELIDLLVAGCYRARTLQYEFELIDLLVAGCYRARTSFRLLVNYLMFYFAAATTWEQAVLSDNRWEPPRHSHEPNRSSTTRASEPAGIAGHALLLADDQRFRSSVEEADRRLREIVSKGRTTPNSHRMSEFEAWIRQTLAPYNSVGLCDDTVNNMYRYTAAGQTG